MVEALISVLTDCPVSTSVKSNEVQASLSQFLPLASDCEMLFVGF